jgi:arylsulfatase A-like enzyme
MKRQVNPVWMQTALAVAGKATIGKILKDNGYRTSWFGKNHNTLAFQAPSIGPFDQWPIGMGFEYFYGFMGGDTNQWESANLARNTTYIYPYQGNPGYNLTTAMADEAIAYMNQINTLTRTSCSSSTTPRAAPTHPITPPRSGSRRSATCTCSTRAGTSCVSRSSRTRRSSA